MSFIIDCYDIYYCIFTTQNERWQMEILIDEHGYILTMIFYKVSHNGKMINANSFWTNVVNTDNYELLIVNNIKLLM